MKGKIITVEVETEMNNNDLKNFVRGIFSSPGGEVKVIQVQVNFIKPEKK